LKRLTDRKRLEKRIEKLITEKMRFRFGNKCQLCGKEYENGKGLGQFHVLPKGAFPNLKYRPENIVWACWFKCHYSWHHDFMVARDEVLPRIKNLLGDDYEERLKNLSNELTKTNMYELEKLYQWWSEKY